MAYDVADLTRLVRTKTIICECGCWIWTGANSKSGGYPRFELKGKSWLVHRYAYEKLVGPIDEGMTLDHRECTSRCCINPEHMDVVSLSENSSRANATRWHDFKFDADGNPVERVWCKVCIERDGRDPRSKPGISRRPHNELGTKWADFPEADDVVGLDV